MLSLSCDSLSYFWKEVAGLTCAPQWCLSCTLCQIWPYIGESRWHLPLRLKLQRRGCACSLSNLGLAFLRSLCLFPRGKSSLGVLGSALSKKDCLRWKVAFWVRSVAIVECNNVLSLFSGVESGLGSGFFVLLLFFNVFDVKVGRGKNVVKSRNKCLEWDRGNRNTLSSLWFTISLCCAGPSSLGFVSTCVETLSTRERQ